jgi:cytoskeleton protein RodZ
MRVNGGDHRSAEHALSAGSLLRDTREAGGLSIDVVAQQLKLAPRQVRAIEEDDYARLPGRTFVRGFVRNYARLLGLDPDAVVAALPRGEATSPLERLTFTPTGHTMGELPVESPRRRGGAARWLIPLALLAIVAAAAYYEYGQPLSGARRARTEATSPALAPASPSAGQTTTARPNPLDKSPPSPPSAEPAPATAATPVATASPASAAVVASTATLVLTWTGPSWVEVKDANGAPVLTQTATAGTTQSVAGLAPLDVVIGNASNVTITFRGQPFDLAPHTRYNVARFSLK